MNNKECYLSARCTYEDKERIERYVRKSGKRKLEYIVDACLAPTERKTKYYKKVLIKEVQLSEQINKIDAAMKEYKSTRTEASFSMLEDKLNELGRIILCRC